MQQRGGEEEVVVVGAHCCPESQETAWSSGS